MNNYIAILNADLEKGYSKSDLEKLIGLPKNNLSGILKGDRKLSKKSQLKIDKWQLSEKPHPLHLELGKKISDAAEKQWADEGEAIANVKKDLQNGCTATKGIIPQITEDYELRAINQRIVTLESELRNPPKTAIIGVKNWIRTREIELSELKSKIESKL